MQLFTSALRAAIILPLLSACSGNVGPAPVNAGLMNTTARGAGALRGAPIPGSVHSTSGIQLVPGQNVVVALQTSNDVNYVTAVAERKNEPNCGAGEIALHDNATTIGPDEVFTPVYDQTTGQYAFAFSNDGIHTYYIVAVNGGGIGGPNGKYGYSQLHTDATTVGPDEKFTIVWVNSTQIAFKDPKEKQGTHYVTAFGNCGGNRIVPFHTNATSPGGFTEFTLYKE